MSEVDWETFKREVESNKAINQEDIETVLHTFKDQSPCANITCKFYLIRCTADEIRDLDLIKLMLNRIVFYVLKKKEYQGKSLSEFRDLYLRAKETFVKEKRTGEAGELLLFLLLESQGIVQLFSKMGLKTSGNVHFHGFDAVHIEVGKVATYHFGHSKMHAQFSSALNEAVGDVLKFSKDKGQKSLELNLISSHVDESKFGIHSDIVRNLINPYYPNRAAYKEAHSIFLASDWQFLKDQTQKGTREYDGYTKSQYEKQHTQVATEVAEKVLSKEEIKSETFSIYIIPFLDVQKFRDKFREELTR
jgi:hypothetical protein